MTANILLNISSDSKLTNDTTDNFNINMAPIIPLPGGNWSMGLEGLSLWYSWYNISPDYNNQTFRYNNGAVWKNIIITPGLYAITDLNNFIQAAMLANGDYTAGTPNIFYISLTPDYNTFKLLVTVSNSYEVDFTVGNLYQLLGFTQIVVTTTQEGLNNVNITNGVDRVMIHLDCITGSYSGITSSDVLYSFAVNGAPSSLITINPYRIVWLPLNKFGYLSSFRVYVTDQQNRRLNLNGETVSLSLAMRRIR